MRPSAFRLGVFVYFFEGDCWRGMGLHKPRRAAQRECRLALFVVVHALRTGGAQCFVWTGVAHILQQGCKHPPLNVLVAAHGGGCHCRPTTLCDLVGAGHGLTLCAVFRCRDSAHVCRVLAQRVQLNADCHTCVFLCRLAEGMEC